MPTPRRARDLRLPLVCLNLALLALLCVLTLAAPATAQNAGQPGARARGEYTLLAGRSTAGGPSIIYVIDATNQEVVALRWDQSRQVLNSIGYRNLASDTRITPGR